MSAYLDELYFDWLYSQVCSVKVKSPSKTYTRLFHILYTKEFIWLVPNDDNRAEDGKDLRYIFLYEEGIPDNRRDSHWLALPCSMLEFLIGLAKRMEFETDMDCRDWFWHLLDNIGLAHLNDRADVDPDEVEDTLDRVIWRTYDYDGSGGLFPLKNPERNQCETEIWYQLSDYILEGGFIREEV
jgi:hypothetical protein